jgi:hypothetical protein
MAMAEREAVYHLAESEYSGGEARLVFGGSTMRISLGLLLLLVTLVLPASLRADSGFRCRSGRLVSVGDVMGEVRDRCGEPDVVNRRIEKRKVKHKITRRIGNVEESYIEEQEIEIPIDEWTYDMGPHSFTRYVVFENSRVIDVITGDYGKI